MLKCIKWIRVSYYSVRKMSELIRFQVCEREDWQEKVATDNICAVKEMNEVFAHIVVAFMMKYSVFWEVDHCDSAVEFFEKFPDTKLTIKYGECTWDTSNITLWEPALHIERIDELYKATIEHENAEIAFLRKKMSAERSNVANIRMKVQGEMGMPTHEQWAEMIGSYEDNDNSRHFQEAGYGSHYEDGYDSY